MIPFPDKKYDIIYADPAWDMEGREFQLGHSLADHYQTMSIEDIMALPVDTIAKPDTFIYLWTTDNLLHDALHVLEAWGFAYKRSFIWDKVSIGMGVYNRGQHEQLLFGKCGKPLMPKWKDLQGSVVSCKRGKHSVKPVEFKHIIERTHPNTSKIELFARPSPLFKSLDDGWDYWGNEV